MSSDELRCQATTASGEPCGSPPSLVDPETGLCAAHSPDASERLAEAGRKGGKVRAQQVRKGPLDPNELPPLDSHESAETWCDVIGRAVAMDRIGHNEAQAALRAVREWRASHEAGQVSERLEQLTDALAEWRKTGDPEPVMELVD